MQFLRGYCILLPDPIVASLNDINRQQRADFLCDMALVGDVLMEVTGAYRINYAIMGNLDPALHAHIVPRYLDEPEEFRKGLPWSYPKELVDSTMFDYQRDKGLMQQIAGALTVRIASMTDTCDKD
jgi:diadenosine tetraphosphate (Ap4A) HIT family hydrolase